MIGLTKETDYALLALSYLAMQGSHRIVNTKEIAESYHIPVELLAKVLQNLGRSGFVTSHAGPKGGYVLARDPNQITIAQVIQAVEGPMHMAVCFDEHKDCAQIARCTIRDPVRRIQSRVEHLLATITLSEMNDLTTLRGGVAP